VNEQEARERFGDARVAHLATVGSRKQPHLVPITFVLGSGPSGDAVCFAVDGKAKTTRDLKRLENIAANPKVSVLVDFYDDDWRQLWWVRADGEARIVEGGATFTVALQGLAKKYPQYAEEPPAGPVVLIDVDRWQLWEATPS
jgi:PPOX class probable F420-dependent enzyme